MIGFTDLERIMYATEYIRWRSSPWGQMQCMSYNNAVSLSPQLEPQYEQIFLKTRRLREFFNKGKP